MKKRFALILGALSAVALFVGCSTLQPVQGSNELPASNNYRVLGRVEITTKDTKSGYTKLMNEAKKQYPEADDIVHILVDAKQTSFFWSKSYTYVMSAVVIDYTN